MPVECVASKKPALKAAKPVLSSISNPAPELLSDVELARLRLVLGELRLRLRGMCAWLEQHAPMPGNLPDAAAFSALRAKFWVNAPANYQLADFSALWGLTSNPFQEIFDLVQKNPDTSDVEVAVALGDFCMELAKVPNAILEEVELALQDVARCDKACRSLRRFHDFWIDAAERAFCRTAHTDALAKAQGRLLNALARQANRQGKRG